jgi:hypothetical protein
VISVHDAGAGDVFGDLCRFRQELCGVFSARSGALFELCDAVLCTDGPVVSVAELSLTTGRGHGALYDALAGGRIDTGRLRRALAGLELPRWRDRQLVLAVDVTPWPRPDAECSPQRIHCHRSCRCDADRQTIPGWPYSVIAALGTGPSSWTAPLDILRLGPGEDLTEVTEAQIRGVLDRLIAAGQWREGDPPVLIVADSGYNLIRLSWLLRDLPVVLVGRLKSNRVFRGALSAHLPRRPGQRGPAPRHGDRFVLADAHGRRHPDQQTVTASGRCGRIHAQAWSWLHPELQGRDGWKTHPGPLPVVEGTLISLTVDHLPGNRTPDPMWLWCSDPHLPTAGELDLFWQAYLRRFDLEHTFRFLKQTLGLTRPRLRSPEQADRWAWLVIAAYTQLLLARTLTRDLRRRWEKPLDPHRITPGRVRRGFTHLRRKTGTPARVPRKSRPGPGRPPGSTSGPAPRHPVHRKQNKPGKPRDRKKQKG